MQTNCGHDGVGEGVVVAMNRGGGHKNHTTINQDNRCKCGGLENGVDKEEGI